MTGVWARFEIRT